MRTDIGINKLCDCVPFVADIAEKVKADEKLKDIIIKLQNGDKITLLRSLPILIDKCGEEIYNILSIFNDKTVDEIKAQDFSVTIKYIMDIAKNEDMRSFFSVSSPNTTTENIVEE